MSFIGSSLNLNISYGLQAEPNDSDYKNSVVLQFFKPEVISDRVILRFNCFYISVTGRKINFICSKVFEKKKLIRYIVNNEYISEEFDVSYSEFDLKSLESIEDLPSFLKDDGLEIKLTFYLKEC